MFHNPYHFAPVQKQDRSSDLSVEAFRAGGGDEITHDRYLSKLKSGRMVCRLTTESPMVIGAARHAGTEPPAHVDPFELDPGVPAIPASSLRGLISSIVEAASNSALRVLEDRKYSYRQRADRDALSAIGMIIKKEEKLWLRPLAWPTLEPRQTSLPSDCAGLFKGVNLRVYIGDKDHNSIRDARFPYTTWRADRPVFYGMHLQDPKKLLDDESCLHRRKGHLLGQRPLNTPQIVLWEKIPERKRADYTRGILRVLGCKDRGAIPNTKYHELFIPYPKEAESWPLAPLQPNVINRFYDLADERTEAVGDEPNGNELHLLPYHPLGTDRNTSAEDGRKFRLKHGDLVYFRASGGQITEISLSSIWRGRVEDKQLVNAHSTWDFFRRIDRELLPFTGERTVITAAERLFGFVEQVPKERGGESRGGLALCGRLRFSNGLVKESGLTAASAESHKYYEESVILRILGSPKPPCPAFYFKIGPTSNAFIKKSRLNAAEHQPQGRKFYLHGQPAARQGRPLWETTQRQESLKQKVSVKPVRAGTEFWFHVDFNNLTESELMLLKYALRPTQEFRHKLGMGKSLGLGRVRIDVVGVFFVDRASRYSAEGFVSQRFSTAWIAPGESPKQWPTRYGVERLEEMKTCAIGTYVPDPDIATALQLLGNPSLAHPVHTPTVNADPFAEEEAFAWFVANDRSESPSCLQPIHHRMTTLPALPDRPAPAATRSRDSGGRGQGTGVGRR